MFKTELLSKFYRLSVAQSLEFGDFFFVITYYHNHISLLNIQDAQGYTVNQMSLRTHLRSLVYINYLSIIIPYEKQTYCLFFTFIILTQQSQ